jgi:hypothetical protein
MLVDELEQPFSKSGKRLLLIVQDAVVLEVDDF